MHVVFPSGVTAGIVGLAPAGQRQGVAIVEDAVPNDHTQDLWRPTCPVLWGEPWASDLWLPGRYILTSQAKRFPVSKVTARVCTLKESYRQGVAKMVRCPVCPPPTPTVASRVTVGQQAETLTLAICSDFTSPPPTHLCAEWISVTARPSRKVWPPSSRTLHGAGHLPAGLLPAAVSCTAQTSFGINVR